MSDWADSAQSDLEDAQDALDDEADSLEQSIEQLTGSAQAIGAVLTSGVQTLADVAALDPELGAALRTSSTCRAGPRGDGVDEHERLDPDRARRARRHRLHCARRALGRHRPRALGRRRHAHPRLRLRARPGRAADQRDADHRRRDRRRRRHGSGRRHRLHGPDREQGVARAAEGAELRGALHLLSADDPHGHGQHVLLRDPGDQRARLREQDQARASARRLDRRLDLRDHGEPGRGRDGDDVAARRDLRLRHRRRDADHVAGQHHRHLRDGAVHEQLRQGSGRRRRVPAPPGGRRDRASGTRE